MAPATAGQNAKQVRRGTQEKLKHLPLGAKFEKRPLLHPEIPSARAGSSTQKVIYVSCSTPFMSALRRVKKLLSHVEKRQLQSDYSRQKKKGGRHALTPPPAEGNVDEVVIKATGRAIEKALELALFLQEQHDLAVKIRTGSVAAIDDIVQDDVLEHEHAEEELPESRLRHTSMIDIAVKLAT